jgi:hypothetical protein
MPSSPAEPSGPARSASDDAPEALRERRWALIRDLAVFSGKAALEALRDLALIPVGLAAGVAGLLFHPREPEFLFREVLRLGDRFDRFVDIFGAEARRGEETGHPGADGPSFDALAARVEHALVEQHRRGGVTAQAKEAIDRALDAVQRRPPAARR